MNSAADVAGECEGEGADNHWVGCIITGSATNKHTHILYIYMRVLALFQPLWYMQIDAIETFAVELVSHILVLNYD